MAGAARSLLQSQVRLLQALVDGGKGGRVGALGPAWTLRAAPATPPFPGCPHLFPRPAVGLWAADTRAQDLTARVLGSLAPQAQSTALGWGCGGPCGITCCPSLG